jgi:hypothetical protein
MAYPDWLLKFKTKGIYFQKQDESTYRMIKAHSERRPDRNYPVLVTDEYLGTVSKESGFIPSRPSVKGVPLVKRNGFWFIVRKVHPLFDAATLVTPYLFLVYGKQGDAAYTHDWVSEETPMVQWPPHGESERRSRAIRGRLSRRLGADMDRILFLSGFVENIYVNNRWVQGKLPEEWKPLLQRHGIIWEDYDHGRT